MEPASSQRVSARPVAEDEIDLFELFQDLWQQKWLITGLTTLSVIVAFVFTVVFPLKPVTYTATALVEVATIDVKDAQSPIQTIENTEDVVLAIGQAVAVQASSPRRSTKMIQLEKTASSAEQARAAIDSGVELVLLRHQKMLERMQGIRVIQPTQKIGDVQIKTNRPSDKLNLILAVSLVLGGMLGVFVALIRGAIRKRQAVTQEES
jgi:LPS O-antigen subunit length determinant protein (WzzB/FepE family)